jgi:hypothetical protein
MKGRRSNAWLQKTPLPGVLYPSISALRAFAQDDKKSKEEEC